MPPYIPGVSFSDALARFKSVGWYDDGQAGSHRRLNHPKRPGVTVILPDHRRRDIPPATLGNAVEKAGLTEKQFLSLTGSGHRRNVSLIRKEVYGMAD